MVATYLVTSLLFSIALASDEVTFKSFELDASLEDIVWCGDHDESVLVLTDDGKLFKSRDQGYSWKKLTKHLTQSAEEVLESGQEIGLIN